jgi:hypothetical protein
MKAMGSKKAMAMPMAKGAKKAMPMAKGSKKPMMKGGKKAC